MDKWQEAINQHELSRMNMELCIAYLDDTIAELHIAIEKLEETRCLIENI